jgi:DNA-binding response OmpR family regulator
VDDDEHIRELLRLALPLYGIAVRLAADGEEGVSLYRRHRDTLAAVLLDLRLRRGNGRQVHAALRAIDPAVRLALMSGDPGNQPGSATLVRVIPKPFRIEELAATLRNMAEGGDWTAAPPPASPGLGTPG